MKKEIIALFVSVLFIISLSSVSLPQPYRPAEPRPVKPQSWPSPSLEVFGEPAQGKICVSILGQVTKPGHYYIDEGATVEKAVDSAGGLTDIAWKHRYSGITRPSDIEIPSQIRFTKEVDCMKVELQEGDQLFFGHETY